MKKTKIICTIGPSSMDDNILEKMINSGMDVARINMSHCTHDLATEICNKIRNLNKKLNKNVGILIDTKGPEIRVGKFLNGFIELIEGDTVILTPSKADGSDNRINISHSTKYKIFICQK